MNLFVYGTLMVPQVMHAVCGFTAAAEPAVLQGHRRRRVRARSIPVSSRRKASRSRACSIVG